MNEKNEEILNQYKKSLRKRLFLYGLTLLFYTVTTVVDNHQEKMIKKLSQSEVNPVEYWQGRMDAYKKNIIPFPGTDSIDNVLENNPNDNYNR